MRTFLWVTAIMMFVASGCASSQSTSAAPPSVDVTGTWVGTFTFGNESGPYTLRLQQTGSKVVGEVMIPRRADNSGPIKGTVSGNALSFRNTSGHGGGEFVIAGNEMRGQTAANGPRVLLQRQQ